MNHFFMKKQLVLVFCVLVLNFLGVKTVFAQTTQVEDAENLSLENAKRIFITAVKEQSRLFNGPTYYTYGSGVDGSAIFLDTTFIKGTIFYEGIKYNEVPLMYDLYIDKLVSVVAGSAYSLISEKVSEFEIANHHFRYLNFENSANKAPFEPGFFEVLYDGKIRVIAKHNEKLGFSTKLDIPYYFKPKTVYLLEKDNHFYKFSDDGSLINLLDKNKKEMKKLLQEASVRFKDDPIKVILLIAKYHDSLAN
ncbi:hypothetical protein EZ428_12800 [Pedobacter frigiditerrae]|uniref:GLPGLI family protein n=1 Tax=Pedobacter frigiditerrae TaxID=2530452 RepID=A0A4R0MT00_9SPHI|nr:hypothetical protein [Pedobacter frigiditerrae]TCC90159.1 hypothetical protein EZ428_12800 [Pedobacter frigiditerrae]